MTTSLQKRELPPLELRTAYTQKGIGIGVGGFIGQVLGGPYLAILGGFLRWKWGNQKAILAERNYLNNL